MIDGKGGGQKDNILSPSPSSKPAAADRQLDATGERERDQTI